MPKQKRTPAQILAAQRNGARSRGPLTEESRARSARNSLKHGLTANTIVLPGENRERFQLLLDDLLADLAPQTTLEFTAVEEIAAGLWRQRRSWAVENSYFAETTSENDIIGRYKATWKKLHKPGLDFHNLLLQQARVNFHIDRAYRRFRELESLRAQAEQALQNEPVAVDTPQDKNEPGDPSPQTT